MKCQSIACLWSPSPPQHKVTATAVLANPPTLYTGGSDGSIFWWNLSGDDTKQEAWPMALLCGHATAIVDLSTCEPVVGHGEAESSSHKTVSPSSDVDALLSVCRDGVLCVWSRGSGHCKRRRKLPAWAGIPCLLSTLPVSQRYVCVACVCPDSSASHASSQIAEGSELEGGVEREGHFRKGSKFSILVVDTCALSIVRTVFHGSLSLGQLKCMSVVQDFGDGKKSYVVLADTVGKMQLVAMLKEHDEEGSGDGCLQRSISLSSMLGESSDNGENAISVAIHGKIFVHIFRTHCIFKSILTGSVAGEISLVNTPLCMEDQDAQVLLAGGMFLQNDKRPRLETQNVEEDFVENFILWSTTGAAIIYVMRGAMRSSGIELSFETLCEIPPSSHPTNVETSLHFCKSEHYLLRIESICSALEVPSIWRPHVTIWSIPELPAPDFDSEGESGIASGNYDIPYLTTLLGEGGFPLDWIGNNSSRTEQVRLTECPNDTEGEFEKTSNQTSTAASGSAKIINSECNIQNELNARIVSSSMVLSEDCHAPYAVIYGFYSGDIEVIRFRDTFVEQNSARVSSTYSNGPHITKQTFLGHSGAVLCLAAHPVKASSKEINFRHVLVSGSLDCTIRVWNLDTGSLIFVLHHHVAPVKQIILPPPRTDCPWNNCFLSVGEDCCVALVSLETLRVERMFPGHLCYPSMVVWDSSGGYIACLCRNFSLPSDAVTALYLWDVKTGARERVIRGTASYSMFDHFCKGINVNTITGNILGGTTSASLLHLPAIEDANLSNTHLATIEKGKSTMATVGKSQRSRDVDSSSSLSQGSAVRVPQPSKIQETGNSAAVISSARPVFHNEKHPIKCFCPFPGIAALKFDLASIVSPYQTHKQPLLTSDKQVNIDKHDQEVKKPNFQQKTSSDTCYMQQTESHQAKELVEEYLIRFSLAFLHLWDVDLELDKLLMDEMNILRPEGLFIASGVPGDRGSLMLTLPGLCSTLELWKASSEFCAMRSLTIVSLAQRLITLSHSSSAASSALAAFYTRNFAEKVPEIKPPLLQLLVSFWQDPSEHVRMAARSLFHCAAPRAVPRPICSQKTTQPASPSIPVHVGIAEEYPCLNESDSSGNNSMDSDDTYQLEEASIVAWLESYEMQDWISCIGGTTQDAMASHIIVAAALAVWYPSIVKSKLAMQVVHHLIKLAMSANDRYSSTAAELLAEGMDSTWNACIGSEIAHLIGDIFFQIECLSGASSIKSKQNHALTINIRDTLAGVLLPSLAMADIPGFLNVIESQIWATSSDSPVHLLSLAILIRVIRGSSKPLAPLLDKVVNFILQTMDPANTVMRKICFQSSMAALREVARVFPMVALNEASSRLAVGDAIGDIHSITIGVYDLQSLAKIKVLDASGPPGLPSLLSGTSETTVTTGISAVSFSPDGEGLVAFSEHGLVIRWWSLETAWWEKLSRSLVPVQCTKLIFVPPWEGLSPNSSRSSIIASIVGHDNQAKSQDKARDSNDADGQKILLHNVDLSYRLEWIDGRKVVLTWHGHELGSFQF